jgi:hypothetical protein
MALKFGDVVNYVTKSPDGTVNRVNAIVLRSAIRAPIGHDRRLIKDAPEEEFIDLGFVVAQQSPKSNDVDGILRFAGSQRQWGENLVTGWEYGAADALAAATRTVQSLSAENEALHQKIAEKD